MWRVQGAVLRVNVDLHDYGNAYPARRHRVCLGYDGYGRFFVFSGTSKALRDIRISRCRQGSGIHAKGCGVETPGGYVGLGRIAPARTR